MRVCVCVCDRECRDVEDPPTCVQRADWEEQEAACCATETQTAGSCTKQTWIEMNVETMQCMMGRQCTSKRVFYCP